VLLTAVDDKGKIKLFPQSRLMRSGDVCFLIAGNHQAAAMVAMATTKDRDEMGRVLQADRVPSTWEDVEDYTTQYLENRRLFKDDGKLEADLALESRVKGHYQRERPRHQKTVCEIRRSMLHKGMLPQFKGALEAQLKARARRERKPAKKAYEEYDDGSTTTDKAFTLEMHNPLDDAHDCLEDESGLNSTLLRNTEPDVRRREDAQEAVHMVNAGGHILLLLCQPELQWQQVTAFIKALES